MHPPFFDVLATRAAVYPTWISLTRGNPPPIIRSCLLGSVVVNFLVATGLAVPVARGHDVVANGIDDVLREFPFLAKTLLPMLSKPLEHTNGWYDFLEAATCQLIVHHYSLRFGPVPQEAIFDTQLAYEIHQHWNVWYDGFCHYRQYSTERDAFLNALEATDTIVCSMVDDAPL